MGERVSPAATTEPAELILADAAAWRTWLAKNHGEQGGVWLLLAKKGTTHPTSLTYDQALDEALCHGWIDGVRRRLDAVSFVQRFSPRKAKSAWSTVNIKRYRELDAEGRVHAAGRKAFESGVKSQYSFESRPRALSPALLRAFRAKPRAWRFFSATPAWYQRTCTHYVMSAKQQETRERRLGVLMSHCEREQALPPIKLPKARAAARVKVRR